MLSFKRLTVITAILSITSCSTPVKVAYECPRIQLPADPVAPVTKLTDKSTPDEVIKAWVATATVYRNWNKTVRKQVETSL